MKNLGKETETMESTKEAAVGFTKAWYRQRPCENNFILWKPLLLDSHKNMCYQSNLKRSIRKSTTAPSEPAERKTNR